MTDKLYVSTMIVDFESIDWGKLEQFGYFVTYKIPYSEKRKWDYLQNWYLTQSKYPYYMNSGAASLYVKYPSKQDVKELVYEEQSWPWTEMDLKDKSCFHAFIKLLMSDYFNQRDALVSNGDFYLPVYTTQKGNIKVLEITMSQRKITDTLIEFVVEDSATTMIKARDVKLGNMQGAQYFVDSKDGLGVVRRLNPRKISQQHIEQGVYIKLRNKQYRTSIRHLSIGSEYQLRKCRVYHLWNFLDGMVVHFNKIGLPFVRRELSFNKTQTMSADKFLRSQINMHDMTVCLVDDRIRPRIQPNLEPSDFSADLFQRIREVKAELDWSPTFIFKDKINLNDGDLVLRLQDNGIKDFHPDIEQDSDGNEVELTPAILRNYNDPYKEFVETHGNTICQSLTINTMTAGNDNDGEDDEKDTTDSDTNKVMTEDVYMGYRLPGKNWLKLRLENSLYQLYLKEIIRNPDQALSRFPILKLMGKSIFVHADSLVYLDNDGSLNFMPVANNPAAIDLIREQTGWNLLDDVILAALNYCYYPDKNKETERLQLILKNYRFMIGPDYVWLIDDSPERVLYDTTEMHRRLKAREKQRPKNDFKPRYSDAELAIFDKEKLQAYEEFLERDVPEYISFKDLTGKPYRERLYSSLGDIPNSRKFGKLLEIRWSTEFKSPKATDVLSAYTGISYLPETQQYYVGDKQGMDENYRQDKGFVLRRIVVLQSKPNLPPLEDQLRNGLFPLLEVNFVRYRRYTVYPFPFSLIRMWKDMVLRANRTEN